VSRLRAAKADREGRLEAEAALAGAEPLDIVLHDEEVRASHAPRA
jgi:hypothetical protein